jgi:hypothetical protein
VPFPEAVDRELGRLLSTYGLREVSAEHHNLFDVVTWENSTTRLRVGVDRHDAALDATLAALAAPSEEFPVWLVLWATGGTAADARALSDVDVYDALAVEAALAKVRVVLEGSATPMLGGDFSMVPWLRQANALRIEANIRHEPWPKLDPPTTPSA